MVNAENYLDFEAWCLNLGICPDDGQPVEGRGDLRTDPDTGNLWWDHHCDPAGWYGPEIPAHFGSQYPDGMSVTRGAHD